MQSRTNVVPVEERKKVVLVVEDYETIRYMLQATLEHAGYEVLVAEDGLQGWNAWLSNRERIDLVISDLEMPRMRGDALIAKIKNEDPEAKTIVFSGTASHACVPQADLLLTKPGSPGRIRAAVAELLFAGTPEV